MPEHLIEELGNGANAVAMHALVLIGHWVVNLVALVAVNQMEPPATTMPDQTSPDGQVCSKNATMRRGSTLALFFTHYALFVPFVCFFTWLHIAYRVSFLWSYWQAYCAAFSMGVLDFYKAKKSGSCVSSVPLRVVPGCFLWAFAAWLLGLFIDLRHGDVMVRTDFFGSTTSLSSTTTNAFAVAASEYGRLLIWLAGFGFFSDMFFCPLHRLMHFFGPLWKQFHMYHHLHTKDLTCLHTFDGAFVDDFLMPFCMCFGGMCFFLCCEFVCATSGSALFSVHRLTSTAQVFGLIMFTPYSHASDMRLSQLLTPMPDSLNIIAYHRKHHADCMTNFGLMFFTDIFWDLAAWTCYRLGASSSSNNSWLVQAITSPLKFLGDHLASSTQKQKWQDTSMSVKAGKLELGEPFLG